MSLFDPSALDAWERRHRSSPLLEDLTSLARYRVVPGGERGWQVLDAEGQCLLEVDDACVAHLAAIAYPATAATPAFVHRHTGSFESSRRTVTGVPLVQGHGPACSAELTVRLDALTFAVTYPWALAHLLGAAGPNRLVPASTLLEEWG